MPATNLIFMSFFFIRYWISVTRTAVQEFNVLGLDSARLNATAESEHNRTSSTLESRSLRTESMVRAPSSRADSSALGVEPDTSSWLSLWRPIR